MEPVLSIRTRIAPLAWRVRWHRGLSWSTRCLHYSLLATLPLLLVKPLLPGPAGLWVLGVVITGAGGGLLYGLSRPVALSEFARLVEERLCLQSRLTTALEYSDRQDHSPFALALYRNAFTALPPFRGKEILSLRLPREWWSLLPTTAAVLFLWVAPPLPWHRLGSIQPSPKVELSQRATSAQEEQREGADRPVMVEAPQIRYRRWRARETASSRVLQEREVPFKDTPLSQGRTDFSSFLVGGDDRMRFLGRSQLIPDLRGEEFQSPYELVFQKIQELTGGRESRHLSPDEIKRLLSEIQRTGKKGGFPGPADSWAEEEVAGLTPREAREALEEALERLRDQEEARLSRSEVTLRPGPGSSGGERLSGEEPNDPAFHTRFGPLAGQGRSDLLRGDPTPRLGTSSQDTGLKGQQMEGRSHMINTNILSRAGGGKPTDFEADVLVRYRQIVEEALSRETIPPDYREQVKTYFDSLVQPRGKGVR